MIQLNNRGLKMSLFFLVLVVSSISEVYPSLGLASKHFTSTCETLPAEIHLTKDEFDPASSLVRTCEANVAVNKCEGACVSSTQPSALSSNGFHHECHCCRESNYRERTITLSSCFDSDGKRLTGLQSTMDVTIQEPMDCGCHSCSKAT